MRARMPARLLLAAFVLGATAAPAGAAPPERRLEVLVITGVTSLPGQAAVARVLGDLDGDGRDEIGVESGREVVVVRGRPAGVVDVGTATDVLARLQPAELSLQLSGAATVGDLDGGGRTELVVRRTDRSLVVIPGRRVTGTVAVDTEPFARTLTGLGPDAQLELRGGRDATGDGRPDLLVGLPGYQAPGTDDPKQPGAGVLLSALDAAADQDVQPLLAGQASTLGTLRPGTDDQERLGTFTELVPDVNGDAVADLALLARPREEQKGRFAGEIVVGPGGASELAPTIRISGATSACPASAVGVGDLTRDGLGDVVIGDPCAAGGRGALRLVAGSRDARARAELTQPKRGPRGLVLPRGYTRMGAPRSAGDVDRNGTVDLAVPVAYRGKARVLVIRTVRSAVPVRLSRAVALRAPGSPVRAALEPGDVDGDGRDDAVIGAAGRVIVAFGPVR